MIADSWLAFQAANNIFPWLAPLLGLLFGLMVGSFLNVVILRLPARLEWEWMQGCPEAELSSASAAPPGIIFPGSRCPSCGHSLAAWENIPLLSYLILRAKCSQCGSRISWRYPAIELFTGIITAGLLGQFGFSAQSALWIVFAWYLIAMIMIDIDHQLLPDSLTLPLLWIGLLASIWNIFITPSEAILGAVIGYGVLWSVFQIHHLLTGKVGMGHGDFKLLAAIGAWGGWEVLPLTIILASAVGSVVGLGLQFSGRLGKDIPIAFGPYLGVAGFVALLFGDWITQSYLALFN